MTDRELMQMALDWADNHGEVVFAGGGWNAVNPMNEWTRPLRARLAQPEPEPNWMERERAVGFREGHQAALKQRQWEPLVERRYSPDGVLLSEKIKYTPDGEWQDLKQQPVAWWHDMGDVVDLNVSGRGTPLYFAPPQREWQGLTDEDIKTRWDDHIIPVFNKNGINPFVFARAIEAKLKEKNA